MIIRNMISTFWKLKNGEVKQRESTGEEEGGQTLWLAREEKNVEKKTAKRIQGNLTPGHVPLNSCLGGEGESNLSVHFSLLCCSLLLQ